MEAHRVGLPLAVGIAVVAAGAATFALRPRSELIEPAPVAATDYFSASELNRIHDYRDPQRLLGLGGLVVSGGTLALIALRPPRRLRRALGRGAARPILAAAAAGGALSVVLVVVELPLSAISQHRARDLGLSTPDLGGGDPHLAPGGGGVAPRPRECDRHRHRVRWPRRRPADGPDPPLPARVVGRRSGVR